MFFSHSVFISFKLLAPPLFFGWPISVEIPLVDFLLGPSGVRAPWREAQVNSDGPYLAEFPREQCTILHFINQIYLILSLIIASNYSRTSNPT